MQENHLDNHKTPHTMKNKTYYLKWDPEENPIEGEGDEFLGTEQEF